MSKDEKRKPRPAPGNAKVLAPGEKDYDETPPKPPGLK